MLSDAYLTYQFIKRLVMPFKSWPACKLGIIDATGKPLKKRSELTAEQRAAYGMFDLVVANIKRFINRSPGGDSMLKSMAMTALLVKEEDGKAQNAEEVMETLCTTLEHYEIREDAPTNSAGGGAVAGLGVPPDSIPGAKPRAKRVKRGIRVARSIWR